MRNTWLVAKQTYLATVLRRGFLIATLALPLGIAALIGFVVLVEKSETSSLPIGYVDQAGLLNEDLQAAEAETQVRAFDDEETALAALRNDQLQAVFVLPAEYPDTLETDLYYLEEQPSQDAWQAFDDFVRANLVASLPTEVAQRLVEGPSVTVHDLTSGREFSEESIVNVILPFALSFLFIFATMMASGYSLTVVSDEKENRTMEIMLTSITPGQLIGGKTIGLLGATLTQLAIYGVAAVVGLRIAMPTVPELQHLVVPWGYLGAMALFFFPAYALAAALMIAIGSAAGEQQQGQQIAGFINLAFLVPMFALMLIIENSGHPIVTVLTLFPTTSFLTISLRWGIGAVPFWQMAVAWVLLVASVLAAVWLAARLFRVGMLRYGQPLGWKAIVAALRE